MNDKVIGKICANQHPRIAYRDAMCPMCQALSIALRLKERLDELEAKEQK